jgi:hypothetical protein
MYECQCNGRLQTKRFTRLSHTGLAHGRGKKKPQGLAGGVKSDQRKIPFNHFTIGFQKQGISADSLLLESNGKMVQWDFSLIKKWKNKFYITIWGAQGGV